MQLPYNYILTAVQYTEVTQQSERYDKMQLNK